MSAADGETMSDAAEDPVEVPQTSAGTNRSIEHERAAELPPSDSAADVSSQLETDLSAVSTQISTSPSASASASTSATSDRASRQGSDTDSDRARAYLEWIQALSQGDGDVVLSKVLSKPEDLCDGIALFDILSSIDVDHFRNPHASHEPAKDNLLIRLGTLKRLYRQIMLYYSERLASPAVRQPDLDAIARHSSLVDLNLLCRLAVGLAVQSDRRSEHIAAIQTLKQQHQHALMVAIEEVVTASAQPSSSQQEDTTASEGGNFDSRVTDINVTRLKADKEALEASYVELARAHELLKTSVQDTELEKAEIAKDLKRLKDEIEVQRREGTEAMLRADVERLKAELRRSEDNLGEAESEVERLTRSHVEQTRKVDDLGRRAEEATRLKDQLDEYKHAADRAARMENVVEKYKKKLEEGADVRRQLKVLEDQNAELVDKNAALEDEYKRVAAFKPLMDTYKSQISELESKASNLQRDYNGLKYEHEQTTTTLRTTEEARTRDREEMELYQERIQELELGSTGASKARQKRLEAMRATGGAEVDGAEGLAAANSTLDESDDDDDVGGEIDDALSGTTMTDLKIRVRKLARELEAAKANKADVSRILVLENLLEDSRTMKERYEQDYLKEHQAKLKLQSQLETIQSGKSSFGDGEEAAYALRLRLNETVEELDSVKRDHAALTVTHEEFTRELNIAKSDLTLVNKDQVDILHTLRASVDVEKADLEGVVSRLREQLKSVEEQKRMQTDQINKLLMEKVDLQSEGIGQREEALRRERNLGELRSSLAGKALPKEAEELIISLQTKAAEAESNVKAGKEKLSAARKLIKEQDKLIKAGTTDEQLAAATASHKSQIATLRRELRLMASAFHDQGAQLAAHIRARSRPTGGTVGMAGGNSASVSAPASWLVQQRRALTPGILLAKR
ncbi:HOOK-domain-containing protein [Ceraceosorus guamensis]|uniref:HOOK-domain-containing protein n=1 Tax=Ceraceosorus guamensis TaxID=1522189 RepID=A0A316W3U8_9BASI|nr:HOOK-domain-containing protein [Ceraceosorus guamensis]PWN44214.1 HOOK-domain-containing protein [Ceraceosorus guamensis]